MNKGKSLTPSIKHIVQDKGTEYPQSGEYNDFYKDGSYLCRQCGTALFRSKDKFDSGCGWPSFEDQIPDAIKEVPDKDGKRTEIVCSTCGAHLGHVFRGEKLTFKNLRHCVNSLSLDHIPNGEAKTTEEAIYAGGCFWGVQYLFDQLEGVLKTEVGYTNGTLDYPSYQDVCEGNTGHLEAIRVIYNPEIIPYTDLTKYFFEIHDPTQKDGQGPDIGEQYHSALFYYNEEQQEIAKDLIQQLEKSGLEITTKVLPVSTFWKAEESHQDYYKKKGGEPYCHIRKKRF